jgi:hypothetical protein
MTLSVEVIMSTKEDPGTYNCYERAMPNEHMFVLLARDPIAPLMVEFWAFMRTRAIDGHHAPETDRAQVEEAQACADAMRKWRHDNYGAWWAAGSHNVPA